MIDTEPTQAKSSSILGGWKQIEGEPEGTFTTEKPIQDFTTPEYAKFAESSRASWDLIEFIKVKIQQHLKRK